MKLGDTIVIERVTNGFVVRREYGYGECETRPEERMVFQQLGTSMDGGVAPEPTSLLDFIARHFDVK